MDKCESCGLIFCEPLTPQKTNLSLLQLRNEKFENDFFKKSFENRLNIFYPRIEIIKKS